MKETRKPANTSYPWDVPRHPGGAAVVLIPGVTLADLGIYAVDRENPYGRELLDVEAFEHFVIGS